MSDAVVVGRIAKAHGIRGEVSVEVLSENPERFAIGARLGNGDRELTIRATRKHGDRLLVKFEEIPDRNGAEALRGTELTVPEDEVAPLPEGRYYPHQLRGLAVVDPSGTALGTFERVERSPAHDIWVVGSQRGEVLVPAVKEFVREVDLERGRITIDPPEGLFK
jgi:16S rRNA processing protein RimM